MWVHRRRRAAHRRRTVGTHRRVRAVATDAAQRGHTNRRAQGRPRSERQDEGRVGDGDVRAARAGGREAPHSPQPRVLQGRARDCIRRRCGRRPHLGNGVGRDRRVPASAAGDDDGRGSPEAGRPGPGTHANARDGWLGSDHTCGHRDEAGTRAPAGTKSRRSDARARRARRSRRGEARGAVDHRPHAGRTAPP